MDRIGYVEMNKGFAPLEKRERARATPGTPHPITAFTVRQAFLA